jgi:hypothetical protein
MVHARAFSFTDDATSVSLPATTGRLSRKASISGPIGAVPPGDPAPFLFQLRCIQSKWYQTLFQSDPTDPLPDAAAFIWQMCQEMRELWGSLPGNVPTGIRDMFDLELRYSYVYCIAPSAKAPHMTDYGRLLIFEHAIAYIDRICEIAHDAVNPAFYTYHDALRVYFMGSQFVAVLRDAADALLSGNITQMPLTLPGTARPPPIPQRFDKNIGDSNLDRSLRCLERVSLTLKKYGERWGDSLALMGSFDLLSAETMEDLKARQSMRHVAGAQQQQIPPNPQIQVQFVGQGSQIQPAPLLERQRLGQSQGQQEVRWVDVNDDAGVAQMMHGGGMV